jgi:hypothetical protein
MLDLFLVFVLLISVPMVAIRRARRPPSVGTPTEWQPNIRIFCTLVRIVGGDVTRSLYLMRRPGPDGKWQYRKMAAKEFAYYMSSMPTVR